MWTGESLHSHKREQHLISSTKFFYFIFLYPIRLYSVFDHFLFYFRCSHRIYVHKIKIFALPSYRRRRSIKCTRATTAVM